MMPMTELGAGSVAQTSFCTWPDAMKTGINVSDESPAAVSQQSQLSSGGHMLVLICIL
jgi:hypothetical protein